MTFPILWPDISFTELFFLRNVDFYLVLKWYHKYSFEKRNMYNEFHNLSYFCLENQRLISISKLSLFYSRREILLQADMNKL